MSDSPFPLRIAPTPQQGGTQTLQQSIYLTHRNPCGNNLLVYNILAFRGPMGFFTYYSFKEVLDAAMQQDNVSMIWDAMRLSATAYLVGLDSLLRTQYLQCLWGMAIFYNLTQLQNMLPPIAPGTAYKITVFDGAGNTIWDSSTPQYNIITTDDEDNLIYTQIPLVQPNPFGLKTISLYGIKGYPGVMPYLDPEYVLQLQPSEFTNDQMAYPESEMCIASLLTDPANTRTFGFMGYGFSARTVNPERNINYLTSTTFSYNCAYFHDLFSTSDLPIPLPPGTLIESNLLTSVGVRLTAETRNSTFGYQPFAFGNPNFVPVANPFDEDTAPLEVPSSA